MSATTSRPATVLAPLDTNDLELALRNADAAVGSAKSRLDGRREGARRATRRSSPRASSPSRCSTSGSSNSTRPARALDAAIATRDQAANQAAYSELKADAAGIVTEIRAEVGQVVSAGAPVGRRRPRRRQGSGDRRARERDPPLRRRRQARGALLGRRRDHADRHGARSVGQRRLRRRARSRCASACRRTRASASA